MYVLKFKWYYQYGVLYLLFDLLVFVPISQIIYFIVDAFDNYNSNINFSSSIVISCLFFSSYKLYHFGKVLGFVLYSEILYKLNSDKTQIINFHLYNIRSRFIDSPYLPSDSKIVSSPKCLGVVTDARLTW